MVDGNVYRENVLPSERAWAYRMYLEAEKKQAGRPAKNLPKISANFRSDDEIGKSLGISGDTLRNYIQLTELRQELMDKVDTQEIGLSVAYQLAALAKDEQGTFAGCNGIFAEYTVTLSGPAAEKSQQGRDTYAGDNAGDAFRGEKNGGGKADVFHGHDPQILSPLLHAQTDAGDHHQAAGGMAEKAPTQPRSLITYDKLPDAPCDPVFLCPKSGGHYVCLHISL